MRRRETGCSAMNRRAFMHGKENWFRMDGFRRDWYQGSYRQDVSLRKAPRNGHFKHDYAQNLGPGRFRMQRNRPMKKSRFCAWNALKPVIGGPPLKVHLAGSSELPFQARRRHLSKVPGTLLCGHLILGRQDRSAARRRLCLSCGQGDAERLSSAQRTGQPPRIARGVSACPPARCQRAGRRTPHAVVSRSVRCRFPARPQAS